MYYKSFLVRTKEKLLNNFDCQNSNVDISVSFCKQDSSLSGFLHILIDGLCKAGENSSGLGRFVG